MPAKQGDSLPQCATCDDDGYVDIVDDFGGVVGPAPCPDCLLGGTFSDALEEYAEDGDRG